MSDRYYLDDDLSPGEVELTGAEAHHLAVVCRIRAGEEVVLFNGRGEQYQARVLEANKRSVVVEVLRVERPAREVGFRLEVAVALPKGDRADFLVEKLTEVGVTSLVPLQTARSIVHPRDSKLERLQRQVIEASKQCGRNVLMQVGEMVRWSVYCETPTLPRRRILAHPSGESWSKPASGEDTTLAIGPEGGFTDEEILQGSAAGWQLVGLGPRILRVETAAMALATLVTQPA
jgi:16S rRNA (uracil1498-N3)-methyltransferase